MRSMPRLNKIACQKFIFKFKPKHTNFGRCNYNDISPHANAEVTRTVCAINIPRKSTSLNSVGSSSLYIVQSSRISLPLCDFEMYLQKLDGEEWAGLF
jgi:hypothetical protein